MGFKVSARPCGPIYAACSALALVLLAVGSSAVFSPMTARRVETIALGEPGLETHSSEARYAVHFDGEPVYLFGAARLPLRACLTTVVDQCVPQYKGTRVCKSVTPSCVCYRWAFAGATAHSTSGQALATIHSVVNVSEFQQSLDCVDFVPTGPGTITLEWRLTTSSPVLPPMYSGLVEEGYERWVGKHHKSLAAYAQLFAHDYCQEDPLDVIADCAVQHSIEVRAGRNDWATYRAPNRVSPTDRAGIIAGGTVYALVLLALLWYFVLHDNIKIKLE